MNRIKYTLTALCVLLAGCEKDQPSGNSGNSNDEADIKSNAKAYEEAYNKKDAEKLSTLWTDNAHYVNSDTGESITGKKAIEDYFKGLFTAAQSPKILIVIDQVIFQGSDKAIEKGHVKITYPDNTEHESAFEAEDVKQNGKWFLQSVKEVEVASAPSNYDYLKDLDWLVGNWENTEDNRDIELNFKWDKNKNFLIEHFSVKVMGREEINGLQIIGWDPANKTIKSWVFDSDGEFSHGYWSKEAHGWYVTMTSTLADGSKASSIDIYKNVDADQFTFGMDARDIDGALLPDVGPVKFQRKK